MKKLTTEEFIHKSKLIHGNKYNYSHVVYKNAKTKVKIICDNGHTFEQSPDAHLSGKNCLICTNKNTEKLNIKKFIEKSNLLHKEKYDYSKFQYVNKGSISIIICPIHGEFKQMSREHLNGSGCKQCYYNLIRTNIIDFINISNEKHKNKYDYSLVKFNRTSDHVDIICPIHGVFKQTAITHMNKYGCAICSNKSIIKSQDDYINECNLKHSNKYDYSKTKYTGSKNIINVTCKIHGDFEINSSSHQSGQGCKKCYGNTSKMEIEWIKSFNDSNLAMYQEVVVCDRKFKPDAIDYTNKIIYEFYGDFWHGNPEKYDQNKINRVTKLTYGELYMNTIERENFLKLNGYKIISIWENDYKNNKLI